MYKNIILVALTIALSSQLCLAQASKHSRPVKSHWTIDPVTGSLQTVPFQDFTRSTSPYDQFTINWQLAKLALQLSDLHRGTPLKSAVQRIRILGGREDGGLQRIPATRYYFSPGITVEIPEKNGVVTAPLQLSPGSFHCD
jgi:hypothetical protein